MAIYHLSMKTVSRSAGRSATAAAAYRAGVKIVDRRTGEIHDFTRKGGVIGAAVVLPGGGTMPRAELWNRIEEHHKRKDAVLAREIVIALPAELNEEDRERLAFKYARELADRYGVAADVALHAPSKDGSDKNWHAHIMLTACHVSPKGELGKKCVALDPIHCKRHGLPNAADEQRERWADLANAALAKAGQEARIDHRSHAARDLDELPSYHLGPEVTAILRRGGRSTVVEREEGRRAITVDGPSPELAEARSELESAEQEVELFERAEAAQTALRAREAALAAEILAQFKKPAVAAPETLQQRWQRMSSKELFNEINEREAKLPSVDALVEQDQAVRASSQKLYELRTQMKQAQELQVKSERAQARWREEHPYKAKLHALGFVRSQELAQWEEIDAKVSKGMEKLTSRLTVATKEDAQAREVARINAVERLREPRTELSELRELLKNRLSQEREADKQAEKARVQSQAADAAKKLGKYTSKAPKKDRSDDFGLGM